jgi:tRNA(fMet)-specific endonuclease VapC
MKKILLDTSAYIGFLAGDKNVRDELALAETTYMSIFVLGELFAGFKGGSKEKENKAILTSFLEKPTILLLNTTEETARVFGEVKYNLKKKGTPIPINDVWIAAHAIENGAVLITYDTHFLKIPGLRLWENMLDD